MDIAKKSIILASKSPRRQQLLKELGIQFTVKSFDVEETYPGNLSKTEIPVFLAELKAKPFLVALKENELVISADTIVCLENEVLGKPADVDEATEILQKLSGKKHEVITGVSLLSKHKKTSFYAITDVYFKELTPDEINFYIENYQPFDKAGAYGIQEWIGYIGINHIEGSFYNVMGLPVQRLYEEVQKF